MELTVQKDTTQYRRANHAQSLPMGRVHLAKRAWLREWLNNLPLAVVSLTPLDAVDLDDDTAPPFAAVFAVSVPADGATAFLADTTFGTYVQNGVSVLAICSDADDAAAIHDFVNGTAPLQ
jgi:hypothetical protein